MGPHSEAKERAYQAYRLCPNTPRFDDDHESDVFASEGGSVNESDTDTDKDSQAGQGWQHDDNDDDDVDFDGEDEDDIAHHCHKMWKAEVQAYESMRHLQGTAIPILFGVVEYDIGDSEVIRGILIEYIPGLSIRDYIKRACKRHPRDDLAIASICNDTMAVMKQTGDRVANWDVWLDNMLVHCA